MPQSLLGSLVWGMHLQAPPQIEASLKMLGVKSCAESVNVVEIEV